MDLRTYFESYFDEIWGQRDPRGALKRRGPDASASGLAATALANEEYAAFCERTLDAFESTAVAIEESVEEGERAAFVLRFTGRTRAGVDVTMRGMGFARVVDGRIVEGHNLFDFASLLSQVGGELAPPVATLDDAVRAIARAERAQSLAAASSEDGGGA